MKKDVGTLVRKTYIRNLGVCCIEGDTVALQ